MAVKRQLKGSVKARKSAARLAAVQALYQMAQTGIDADTATQDYMTHRMGIEEEGELFVAADTDMMRKILEGVAQKRVDIDPILDAALPDNKPLNTQDMVLQNILICGVYEIMAHGDIDTGIIINDYVEVAKAFYDGREPSLVNAILDKTAKKIRA